MKKTIAEFAAWFSSNASRLRTASLDFASDEVLKELKSVDSGLSLEMADHADFRELVISASGDPALFESVRQLKAVLGTVSAWLITALKPPRGFEFVLTTPEGGRVEASELFFDPLETDETPPRLGIRVFLPPDMASHPDVERLLWLTAEAGIGEEACSRISIFEAAPMTDISEDPLPIEVLGDFVAHFHKVNRQ